MNVDLCRPLGHSPTIFPVTMTSSIIFHSWACHMILSNVIWADLLTSPIIYNHPWPCQRVAAVTGGAIWGFGGACSEFLWQKHYFHFAKCLECCLTREWYMYKKIIIQTAREAFSLTDGFTNVRQIEVSNTLYLCLTGIASGAIESNPSGHLSTKISGFILKNVTFRS